MRVYIILLDEGGVRYVASNQELVDTWIARITGPGMLSDQEYFVLERELDENSSALLQGHLLFACILDKTGHIYSCERIYGDREQVVKRIDGGYWISVYAEDEVHAHTRVYDLHRELTLGKESSS